MPREATRKPTSRNQPIRYRMPGCLTDPTVGQKIGPPPIGRLKSEHWAQDRNRAVPLTYMVGEGISGIAERDAEPPHLTGCPSRLTIRDKNNETATS